jgi:hypothetical protein
MSHAQRSQQQVKPHFTAIHVRQIGVAQTAPVSEGSLESLQWVLEERLCIEIYLDGQPHRQLFLACIWVERCLEGRHEVERYLKWRHEVELCLKLA